MPIPPRPRAGWNALILRLSDALDQLLASAGSDLLISAGSVPRIRKDGSLVGISENAEVVTPASAAAMLREVLNAEQLDELARKRHLDFAFTWGGRVRIRANAFFQRGSLAAAFRLLPLAIPSFSQLGTPESVIRLIGRPHGLLLVSGPTGSGKSTTLAAAVDHINRTRACHVVTIEDPIEYVHRHQLALVDQRQVGTDVDSFADALRAVFREDPDVVLIGEMRDLETIAAALTIAETGHLVMATLHTNDAAQAVDRILDSYPAGQQQQARTQLAASLAGVVYQQLLPAVGGGRVAAYEVLVATGAIRALIKEGKTHQIRNAMQTGMRDGSQTLEQALGELARVGVVTASDARARSLHPQEIAV